VKTVYTPEQVQEAINDHAYPMRATQMLLELASGAARIKREKVFHEKRASKTPSPEEIQKTLDVAKKLSTERWVVMRLWGPPPFGSGLRNGEVVGNHRNGSNLPGAQIEDFRDDGFIYIRGKKNHIDKWPIPHDLGPVIKELIGKRRKGKIFLDGYEDPVGVMDKFLKVCMREARVQEADKIWPHRFRHAFAHYIARKYDKNPVILKGAMRHKNIAQSMTYIDELQQQDSTKLLEDSFKEA
jgi:integrase